MRIIWNSEPGGNSHDGTEIRQYTGRDRSRESRNKQTVSLWVDKRLPDVVDLELFRLDTDHTCRNSLDCNVLLVLVQPPSLGRGVGEDKIEDDGPCHGDGAEDPEDDCPVGNGSRLCSSGDTRSDETTDNTL